MILRVYCLIVPSKDMIRRETEQIRSDGGNGPCGIFLADDPEGPDGLGVVSDAIDSGDEVFARWRSVELGLNVIVCNNSGQGIEVPIRWDVSPVEPYAGSIPVIYQSIHINQH